MNINSNIYDIDGKIIRKSSDTHKFTIEEVKNKIEYYRNKLKDLAEDDKKAVIYATYMRNLSNYLMTLYAQMPAEQLQAEIAKIKTTDEQVRKAMEELTEELDEKDDGEAAKDITDEVPDEYPTDSEDTTDEESRDAEAIEWDNSDVHEERPVSQGDLLVERDVNPSDLVMDEYVEV